MDYLEKIRLPGMDNRIQHAIEAPLSQVQSLSSRVDQFNKALLETLLFLLSKVGLSFKFMKFKILSFMKLNKLNYLI